MNAVLRTNMVTAPVAFGSGPRGRFRAKLPTVSILPCARFVFFGLFCRNQLVQGLTFGAAK